MTDRQPRTWCLEPETLAAFMDGRLEPRERAEVEAHLASCEDCYEVWMESVETQPDASQQTPLVATTRRSWLASAALVAASAVGALWLWPLLNPPDPAAAALDALVRAVGSARFTEARLSADFAWGDAPSATRGESPDASVPIRQAALTASTMDDEPSTPLAYRAAAAGHLALGEHDAAVRTLETAAIASPEDSLIQLDLGAALLERFRRQESATDAALALDATERAVARLNASPVSLFNRALALEANGRLDDAVAAWDAYIAIDADSPWTREARERKARVQARIGGPPLTDASRMSPDELRTLATTEPWRLLDYLDRVVIPEWTAAVLAGRPARIEDGAIIAAALDTAGRDRYAHDLLKGLAALSAQRSMEAAAALRLLQESRTAFNLSRYAESETAATTAATALRRAGVRAEDAQMQAAFARHFLEDRAGAVARADRIARTAEAHGYLRLAGRAAYMRGQHQIGRADLAAGLATLEHTVDLYTRAGDRPQVSATHSQLMLSAAAAGQVDRAWRYAAESVAALSPTASPRIQYMVLSNLQYRMRDASLFHAAVALGARIQVLADAWNDPVYAADVALLQAGLYRHLEQDDQIRQVVALGRAHAARIPDVRTRAQYEHSLDFVIGRAFHARDAATALPALDRIIERLTVLNRPLQASEARLLRGRAHRASGNPAAAEADWMAGLELEERERLLLTDAPLAISRADRQWDLYAALIDHHGDDAIRSLEIAERARARALLSGQRDAFTVDHVRSVGAWLPPGTTVLAYAVLHDTLAVWTIRAGQVSLERRPLPREGLDTLVTRFTDALRKDGLRTDGRALASLLLPATPLPTGERVVVIPDGPLHRLPFAALRTADDRLLLDTVEVAISPSLAWMQRATRVPVAREHRALLVGFGGAQPDFDLHALPRVTDEIRSIAQSYGDRARTLLGPAASVGALRAHAAGHSILHIAGHAVADDRRPWESRIFLAPAGRESSLAVSDISRLALQPGALVLLSACSTAAGGVFRGEGIVNLARPFLSAGASAVLASLWPVRDDDAARVMVAVHRELARGASLATALTTVQRADIQAHPDRWPPWMVLGVPAFEAR